MLKTLGVVAGGVLGVVGITFLIKNTKAQIKASLLEQEHNAEVGEEMHEKAKKDSKIEYTEEDYAGDIKTIKKNKKIIVANFVVNGLIELAQYIMLVAPVATLTLSKCFVAKSNSYKYKTVTITEF